MVYKSLNQLVFIWFDLNEKITRFEVKKKKNFVLVHVIISVMVYILL